ncbi:iron complex outermembrane receptor protein [Kerstersia gyiorum]|uniref:Iron complex outermembrane receptor protein n=1 Tax=Kerstersia gyiorum TaxID=206506 RepID=A0A4Q7MT21_9BURK|nr:TonB-dependent receptor [Kerstersia gyiorum]KAB0543671.1 TonB-dependent receptor [Kerstersia gyiorum]RZS70082.1 iron complex outermembrane receptor protein [Kerstersia gyiorum]
MFLRPRPLHAALAAVLFGSPAILHAQAATADVTQLAPVVITADALQREQGNLAQTSTVLQDEDLAWHRRGTLGLTLDHLPGINSDSFGNGATRPVIRGQTAPRVKVLSDGADIFDASSVSPDHIVTVDPLLARRVEVLRGPAALLYGGSAIGGVVNVVDDKIPTRIPDNGLSGQLQLRGATGSNERAGAFAVTAGEGNVALHVEGSRLRSDDYRVPGQDFSKVADSNTDSTQGSLGFSFIGDRGYLGLAYSYREDDYGLPGHSHEYESCHPHGSTLHCGSHSHDNDHDHEHSHDHGEGGHSATAHLRSERVDLRGELRDPLPGFDRLRLRASHTDYRHDERDAGEVATTFTNHGRDLRLELQHQPLGRWHGVVGLQTARSHFESSGLESFVPRTRTSSTGLFLLEEYRHEDWRFEVGARQEWQRMTPTAGTQPRKSGHANSLSAAAIWDFTPGYAATVSFSRSQRLANAQETYAKGVHLATNTYERGNTDLGRETANTVELGLRKDEGDLSFALNAYHSRVDGYIYAETLDQFEDFRLIEYTQRDASFTGLEAEATYQYSKAFSTTIFGDYVRGKLRDPHANLPRIPAARLGLRASTAWQQWHGFLEYYRVFSQNKIASYEEDTPGYNMVNAGLSYSGKLDGARYRLYLQGNNLLDRVAYNHVSFISRAAPIQGRSVIAGVGVEF